MALSITQAALPGMPPLAPASSCRICERPLTDPTSIARGIGPTCARKHGAATAMTAQEAPVTLDPFDRYTMDITCRRLADGTPVFNIAKRHRHHDTTEGMEFGYGGSGPADLALNILALFQPAHPSLRTVTLWDGTEVDGLVWDAHQDFKNAYLAALPDFGGTIPGDAITAWLDHWANDVD